MKVHLKSNDWILLLIEALLFFLKKKKTKLDLNFIFNAFNAKEITLPSNYFVICDHA